jgi:AI-2E family transporter
LKLSLHHNPAGWFPGDSHRTCRCFPGKIAHSPLGGSGISGLHLVSANLLVPKIIGSRVNIGPVAATIGMLFWSWVWGGVGFLLAVPLTAFVKLVADCHPALLPIANLLAETPRPIPRWAQVGRATVTRAIPFLRDRFQFRQRQ